MKLVDIMNRVRGIAGDTNVLQFTDQNLVDWVNDGMRECAIQNNLLQKSATSTVVSGTTDYDLPTDIAKLHSVKYNGVKLPVLTLEEFDEQFQAGAGDTGQPVNALIWAGKLRLYPAPDNSTGQLQIDYIRTPVELTIPANPQSSDTQVPEIPVGYHRRLIDYCLAMVAEQDDDMGRYQVKMQEFQSGVQNLKEDTQREQDVYPHMSVDSRDMGDAFYDWINW